MDGEEVASNSGSEHSGHDDYATFDENNENDERNARDQRESSGLETAEMSPINSPQGDGYTIFDEVPQPSGEPILRDRLHGPSGDYAMPSMTSGGFPARDTASSGLLISSVTGGGLTPAVAL